MNIQSFKNKTPMQIIGMFYTKFKSIFKIVVPKINWRDTFTAVGYFLNRGGIALMVCGRKLVRHINSHITDNSSDSFVIGLGQLHTKIHGILQRQKNEYEHYAYFGGYPYQSLGILGIYGERASEERFDYYGLSDVVKKGDKVLDIGCNCGFMSILTSYRTGAHCYGIDINPYMTDIGTECAKFLKIEDKIELEGKRFQDIDMNRRFDVVYSFATHWTDDGNYRVGIKDHLMKIHALLNPSGILVFETHCSDVGDQSFYQTMTEMKEHYSWDGLKPTDNNLRELYIMKKL